MNSNKNKKYFGMIRAVKTLNNQMQKEAKEMGYKPDDIVFIKMDAVGNYNIQEKIEGSIVEWQRKNGLVIKNNKK
jgi:hypothetical protein